VDSNNEYVVQVYDYKTGELVASARLPPKFRGIFNGTTTGAALMSTLRKRLHIVEENECFSNTGN